MRETGKVIETAEGRAKILIKRSTACGECGACQVGKEKLDMILSVENTLNASTGDEVEINVENIDFMSAVLILYVLPLIALIAGTVAGYYGFMAVGLGTQSQGLAAVTGLLLMGLVYVIIRKKEPQISKMKGFNPQLVSIREKAQIDDAPVNMDT